MTQKENSKLTEMFGGMLKSLSGRKQEPVSQAEKPEPLIEPAKLLDGTLAELQKRKEALQKSRVQTSGSSIHATVIASDNVQLMMDQLHAKIRADILTFHQTLKTGINEETLNRSQALLRELDGIVSGKSGSGFESRIRTAVIKQILAQCGKASWATLQSLLERADLTWPEPTGLSPWAEPKDKTAATDRMLSETAEAFYNSSPARIADRMFGVVGVWKANYPDQDSPQWRQLVIQGVGQGIFGYTVMEATNMIRNESEELKSEAIRMISTEVESVQNALENGISSPQDIDKILEQVSELCDEVIPGLAWDSVASRVDAVLQCIVR